ncbi:hypothetical protein TVAG_406450 [Trichomonas vaginalis G3]|uniref:Ankyrin repeat protein n=1 Tax=Trichomonas vaginalis (strain ATCC PRA-98 / G3) TaxID=412133 RepID=A2FP01_TRIV3|nr:protein retention in ER lumen [Trichomonas vaginalis G3]EAX93381.1 hypothetical protein TVAG_406450 [Trichomonas vaginalis G3]KAI5509789.1 protein retention in ER lumen [Trichomonas vaginalis G3]|eukprot:XP_001306311.1 hypothetical protein [Trichomonas vaginalis G3]
MDENLAGELGQRLINSIKTKDYDEARRLLNEGADPRWSDESGLNAMDYVQLNNDKDFFKEIIIANRKINVRTVVAKLPELIDRIFQIPDMSFQFKWKVYSWMPLVTSFCPNDVWTVYKVGGKVRIDSTTADWTGSRWARGDISLYIDLHVPDLRDSFIIIDNNTGERVNLLREVENSDEIDIDVDNLLKMDLLKGSLHPEVFQINRSKGTFGRDLPPVNIENRWSATQYDLTNAKITFLYYYSENFGKPDQEPIVHSKTYSGKFWCSRDFPVQPSAITPFLEALTPFKETAKNILTLLGMFESGMPVKATVYVFPTVKFAYEIVNYTDNIELFGTKVDMPPPPETPQN